MDIYNLFPGSFASNCYVLISGDNNRPRAAAVIDPSADARDIVSFLSEKGVELQYIILTHGHFDHIIALDDLRDLTGVPAYIHKNDAEMLTDGEKNAYKLFFGSDKRYRPAERLLEHGDIIRLGNESLKVISTPGHSKGSVCLLGEGFVMTGDTLFADNIGRCDLYGGNMMEMYSSLGKLAEFDKNLTIYPGHGDTNTLGAALSGLL